MFAWRIRLFRLGLLLVLLALTGAAGRAQTYSFTTTVAGSPGDYGPVDGAGTAARFSAWNLAPDGNGNFFFADNNAHMIRKISSAGVVSAVAGAAGQVGSADGPAATARFYHPTGVAFDSAGNLLIADSFNHTIRKLTPAGVVSTVAGQVGAFGGDDGTGTAARFGYLAGLAIDGTGNVFVADSGNSSALRKITPAGVVTTFARPGVDGVTGVPIPFSAGYLAFDRAGNLFVSDWNASTIRKFTPAGVGSIFAGGLGQLGNADGVGTAATFHSPSGLAFDAAGNLFVTDAGNGTLRRIAPDGTVTTIAGQPDILSQAIADGVGGGAHFNSPGGLAFDAAGNLFVIDGGQSVVREGIPTTAAAIPVLTITPDMAQGPYRNVGERATVTFTAAASGAAPISFQWFKNGAPIAGATGATFTIASASTSDQGNYSVAAGNVAGAFTSRPVALTVYAPSFEAFTSRHVTAGGSFLWSIASGAGQLVTVGTNGKILTSSDGQTWTTRTSGTTDWLVGVTYGAGKFVAVGDNGTILVSGDGASWTRATSSGTTQRLNNVVYGGNRFVAVGEGGTIVTSADAQTWTAQSSGVTTWLRGLVYVPTVVLPSYTVGDNGTGRFYASGQNGVVLESTATGWRSTFFAAAQPASAPDVEALADGPMGIGQDGALVSQWSYVLYSKLPITAPDGTLHLQGGAFYYWSRNALGLTARFRGLARGAGAIFATGENGTIAAAQSVAGPWSFIPSGTTANLVGGVFFGNSLFIVGENETILQSETLYPSRLINIATRGQVGTGASTMISGFVVSGTTPKTVLLRAAGPALAGFNLGNTLAAPVLTLFDGANHPIATNTGWGTAGNAAAIATTAANLGAFPFANGSADSALLVTLQPGAYTAQVAGVNGTTGLALVEAYDAETLATQGSRAINISTRGQVGTGANQLIAGFVINGAAARRVLIRAVGPSLAQFGLTGVLAEPQIALYNKYNSLVQSAGAWSAQDNADDIRAAGVLAGAFALQEGSKDAAIVTTLVPGSYTVQVSGANGGTGLAIVEVYDLP